MFLSIESLVGKRFRTIEDIESKIESITGYKAVVCEDEQYDGEIIDFILNYEYRNENNVICSDVGEIFYLKDQQGNMYVTEVSNLNVEE